MKVIRKKTGIIIGWPTVLLSTFGKKEFVFFHFQIFYNFYRMAHGILLSTFGKKKS